MVGSATDGEDIIQDAMIKAFAALPDAGVVVNPEGWLFRIAHNTALDFLRLRARLPLLQDAEVLDRIAAPEADGPDQEILTVSLRTFLRLPPMQRSAVILKDVLDHSIEEITSILGASEAAAKSALQRGRARLREIAAERPDVMLPTLSGAARAHLLKYVDGFKAGDFDSVRTMLAEDVKLDLVARLRRQGQSEVGEYFARYAAASQFAFAAGIVDGRAAMLVFDRGISADTPAYFVALDFDGARVISIRDFLFARYAMEAIEFVLLPN